MDEPYPPAESVLGQILRHQADEDPEFARRQYLSGRGHCLSPETLEWVRSVEDAEG